MRPKMVSYNWDELPPLTEESIARLKEAFARPESEIDLTDPDAPELPPEAWANAVRGRFYRPVKAQVTAKVDSDVVAWLKSGGEGYQTRMNAILRRAMLEELKAKRAA